MNSIPPVSPALDRAWIAERIPHSGAMCLLDQVAAWSDEGIRCIATSHRDPNNPLRSNGRLGAICGVEYAAQAMAVHGAVLGSAQRAPRVGFLASVRNVQAQVDRLDTLDGPLSIVAERIGGDTHHVLYRFTLHHDARVVLSGRAAVILDASDAVSIPEPGKQDTDPSSRLVL